MYAIVGEDEDGEEGLYAYPMGHTILPLVASDETQLNQILEMGKAVSTARGKPFRVLKFDQPIDITSEVV